MEVSAGEPAQGEVLPEQLYRAKGRRNTAFDETVIFFLPAISPGPLANYKQAKMM